jgi:hypothetical protein
MANRDRLLVALTAALSLAAMPKAKRMAEPTYLPDTAASRVVTVTETGTSCPQWRRTLACSTSVID